MSLTSKSSQRVSQILSRTRFPRKVRDAAHVPDAAPVLTLYRSLLREISYLPPAIRTNIQRPITDRFRRRKDSVRRKAHLARGKNALSRIRAANSGDRKAMEDLLWRAFGRKGHQRYELMQQLLPDDTIRRIQNKASDGSDVQRQTGKKHSDREKHSRFGYEKFDLDKVMALMRSQARYQNQHATNVSWGKASFNPKRYYPEGGLNIWGKPMAEKPLQRKLKRFWEESLSKVLPPVDKGVWQKMADLASGAQAENGLRTPVRRTPAKPLVPQEADEWQWEVLTGQSVASAWRGAKASRQRRSGDRPAGPYGMSKSAMPVSQRTLRRVMRQVWLSTPYVEEGHDKPTFAWGKRERLPSAPTALQSAMLKEMTLADGKSKKKKR